MTGTAVSGNPAHGGTRQPAEAFFLSVAQGPRFCLYHAPHPSQPVRGAFLYVHPFAEEMNRSRHMAVLQARRLADAGYAVLMIDLLGCGDSAGDFGDAGWELWKADLAAAAQWLENRVSMRIGLWGLRLGALLALDIAAAAPDRFSSLLLWNPVLDGKLFLTQFLRLRLGSDVVSDDRKGGGTRALRDALLAGETLEIAGYRLAPALALVIDQLHVQTLTVDTLPVQWLEVSRAVDGPARLSPAAVAVAGQWRLRNADVHIHPVSGLPFWATPDMTTCPELLALTTAVVSAGMFSAMEQQ